MIINSPFREKQTKVIPNHNKGKKFPPDPIKVEEIVKLICACEPLRPGQYARLSALRRRALIATLWRTGLRISEALDLEERDLLRQDMALVVRHGKGDKRRLVAMDEWGWQELENWLAVREYLPRGAIFCVLQGKTAGKHMQDSDVRRQFRDTAARANIHRRANPHSFRHEHAVELWREGIDVYTIQQQLGHARLDVTAIYLKGIAPVELLEPIGRLRRPQMMLVNSMV
jgi:site-specific recombinase XerD